MNFNINQYIIKLQIIHRRFIMNIIEIKNMSKNFKNKKLYNDFSLEIEANTVHAIVGPNGSGKTSLLRILTGLYKEDKGSVIVHGDHAMLLENDYLYEDKLA